MSCSANSHAEILLTQQWIQKNLKPSLFAPPKICAGHFYLGKIMDATLYSPLIWGLQERREISPGETLSFSSSASPHKNRFNGDGYFFARLFQFATLFHNMGLPTFLQSMGWVIQQQQNCHINPKTFVAARSQYPSPPAQKSIACKKSFLKLIFVPILSVTLQKYQALFLPC